MVDPLGNLDPNGNADWLKPAQPIYAYAQASSARDLLEAWPDGAVNLYRFCV